MPDDEKRRFADALAQWADAVKAIRARERAEAIARVQEQEKVSLNQALSASALGIHHAWKHRSQG